MMQIESLVDLLGNGGVLPLLFWVASVGSLERGSQQIESIDLLRAMYIADLEHVLKYWDDWENFEKIVSVQALPNGLTISYLNRVLYMVRLYVAANENSSTGELAKLSKEVIAIIDRANALALARSGLRMPSSPDLLLAIYELDQQWAHTLNKSGLRVQYLRSMVTNVS